ncbi:hypothetical protein IWX49DRAFT_160648 [Phyllosticta citricarpa]
MSRWTISTCTSCSLSALPVCIFPGPCALLKHGLSLLSMTRKHSRISLSACWSHSSVHTAVEWIFFSKHVCNDAAKSPLQEDPSATPQRCTEDRPRIPNSAKRVARVAFLFTELLQQMSKLVYAPKALVGSCYASESVYTAAIVVLVETAALSDVPAWPRGSHLKRAKRAGLMAEGSCSEFTCITPTAQENGSSLMKHMSGETEQPAPYRRPASLYDQLRTRGWFQVWAAPSRRYIDYVQT